MKALRACESRASALPSNAQEEIMRNPLSGHRLRAALWAGTVFSVLPSLALAQNQAVITGRVTSSRGDPIAGATVLVNSTNHGASTNANGVYTITILAPAAHGQDATLTARALGHKPVSRAVKLTIGSQEQHFQLAQDPLRLEELVTTGVSEATNTKLLTFSIGTAGEQQLQAAPAVSALGALQGKVAGVTIYQANGAPGTAPAIKLRGSTSISGNQDPLIIVDGTITNYSLSDINSEDIERVEVVKGAAASALYGSNAANGVIQIFTRRGKNIPEGKLQVTTRGEFGQSKIVGRPATTKHHPFVLNPDGTFFRDDAGKRVFYSTCDNSIHLVPGGCPKNADGTQNIADVQDKNYPSFSNTQDLLYEAGKFWTGYVSIGQNRGRTNFNVSFQHTTQQGSVFNANGMKRQNYRVNLDQVISDKMDFSVNSFYARSDNEEPSNGGDTGPFFGIAFLEPHVDATACCNPDGSPYTAKIVDKRSNAANPLYDLYSTHRDRVRSRFAGGMRLRYRPLNWLSAEGNFNFDELTQEFKQVQPVQFFDQDGSPNPGNFFRSNENRRSYNSGLTATANWLVKGSGLTNNLGITVRGAYQYEDQYDRFFSASAAKYIVKQVPEFPGTDPSGQRAASEEQSIRSQNGFGVATLSFDDKIILDGLVRRDGSSLFGPDARWATYFRASGAVRVPQLLGMNSPEEFRLRASYGTAGLRPRFEAQYEVLTASGGTFIKQQLGNRNLKPAKSKEFEVGTNIGLLGGRVTVEYNYSNKTTSDQLILAPLLAFTGFQSQWQNVGSLNAKSHELAIGVSAINNRDLSLQFNLTADRVREVITDWPLPDQAFGGDSQDWGGFVFAQGVRLGQMRGQKWVHNIADLYLDPVKAAANGAGQTYDPAKYEVNYDGYVVLKANRGTNAERPVALVKCVDAADCTAGSATTNIFDIGVGAPDFRVALNPTFAFKRFAVTGLLDWSQGGQIYNATAHWGMQDCADIKCDQSAKPAGQRIAEAFYQSGLYNGASSNEAFVESATFLKLRELSVNYTFNRNEVSKIGLGRYLNEIRVGIIGRNLIKWDKYSGIDPEVAPQGQDAFKVRADWFQYPPFRTFTGFVEIAF
jgi:TonB-linked SusC/RagA family outer membrane protein